MSQDGQIPAPADPAPDAVGDQPVPHGAIAADPDPADFDLVPLERDLGDDDFADDTIAVDASLVESAAEVAFVSDVEEDDAAAREPGEVTDGGHDDFSVAAPAHFPEPVGSQPEAIADPAISQQETTSVADVLEAEVPAAPAKPAEPLGDSALGWALTETKSNWRTTAGPATFEPFDDPVAPIRTFDEASPPLSATPVTIAAPVDPEDIPAEDSSTAEVSPLAERPSATESERSPTDQPPEHAGLAIATPVDAVESKPVPPSAHATIEPAPTVRRPAAKPRRKVAAAVRQPATTQADLDAGDDALSEAVEEDLLDGADDATDADDPAGVPDSTLDDPRLRAPDPADDLVTPDAVTEDGDEVGDESDAAVAEFDADTIDGEDAERDAEPVAAGRSSGGWWTIPLLCAGIALIAWCVIVPQADANRRLAYQRQSLRAELDAVQSQVATNDEFLRKLATDPTLAERLAQRQMRMIRAGSQPLAVGRPVIAVGTSPFEIVKVPKPAAQEPYEPIGGRLAAITQSPRARLYLMGCGLFAVAAGLVLGAGGRRGD